ncbi:MAG: hypothetical protein JRF64_02140 [Deltaproteobacteria bacterium]|jgi:hypothetical protein|nr:hypothetical protein [Deltaproteobacteria bacterium]
MKFVGIVVILVVGFALVLGCAGPSKKAEQPAEQQAVEQKGSLSRTFTIVDEQGLKSGTLTLDPLGGALLRDENGTVIGKFKSETQPEAQPVVLPSEPEPSEAQPVVLPSEPEPSEAQPDTEAKE